MRKMQKFASAAALAGAAWRRIVLAAAAVGQWQFRASIYGGSRDRRSTTFPVAPAAISRDADKSSASQVHGNGPLAAQKGRWGAFTDIVYLDVGGRSSARGSQTPREGYRPHHGKRNLDLKGTIGRWPAATGGD